MGFDYLDNYRDLVTRIKIQQEFIYSLENQAYGLRLQTCNETSGSAIISDMPKGKRVNPELDIALSRLIEINDKIRIQKEVLSELESSKNMIETYISSMEGLKHKVAYLKVIAGKEADYIAKSLGLSNGYINNIISELKQHHSEANVKKK